MIKAAHLYADLMNLYGDTGNMKALACHLREAGIELSVDHLSLGDSIRFEDYDFLYIGSGTEQNLLLALDDLLSHREELTTYHQNGGMLLATGNSMELFGKQITVGETVREALGIADFTVTYGSRVVRDVCVPCKLTEQELIGFENHSGTVSADGSILVNGNFYLTYIIGPLLVRNPQFTDYLIRQLAERTGETITAKPDHTLEQKAYEVFRASMKQPE